MVVVCANRVLLREWMRDQWKGPLAPPSFESMVEQALESVEAIARDREGDNYRLVDKFSTWIGARDGSPRFPVYLAHVQNPEREAITCQMIYEAFRAQADSQKNSLATC